MVAVYQLMFFFSLGLLAISITVFVVAVSLLGRAIALAIEAGKQTTIEHKETDDSEMRKIKGELEEALAEDRHPDIKRLEKAVGSLKRKRWINSWKLRWIKVKPELLGPVWGALIPGAFLMTSVIVSIVAIYTGSGEPKISPYMWIGIATMGIGVCFVCLTLKVIGGVARTSEEIAFKRDVAIFDTSLRKFEEEKRPQLRCQYIDEAPPFHTKADSEMTIKYGVDLLKGEYAEDTNIAFFVPKGFGFPGRKTIIQPLDHDIVPGYITAVVEVDKIMLYGTRYVFSIKIKVASKADKYKGYYRWVCKGAVGGFEEFGIVVE